MKIGLSPIDSSSRARKLLDQKEVLEDAFTLLSDAIVIAHAKDRNNDFKACAAGKGDLDFEYYFKA